MISEASFSSMREDARGRSWTSHQQQWPPRPISSGETCIGAIMRRAAMSNNEKGEHLLSCVEYPNSRNRQLCFIAAILRCQYSLIEGESGKPDGVEISANFRSQVSLSVPVHLTTTKFLSLEQKFSSAWPLRNVADNKCCNNHVSFHCHKGKTKGGASGSVAGRPRVRVPMSLNFFSFNLRNPSSCTRPWGLTKSLSEWLPETENKNVSAQQSW
jgi:hypothetical protein